MMEHAPIWKPYVDWPSCYAVTANPAQARPRLQGQKTWGIVGPGVTDMSAAFEPAERGYRVVEGERVGCRW